MCGIFCALSESHQILPDNHLQERLKNRGPDSIRTVQTIYPRTAPQQHDTSTQDIHLTFTSTVLSLRGSRIITQPYQDGAARYTLCWNGEAWSIDGTRPSNNDTEAIHRLLVKASNPSSYCESTPEDPIVSASRVAGALSKVAGPYAFAFLDHSRGRLYVGRDFLGRRSLLKRITDQGDLIICSVSEGDPDVGWVEIEADGIYCIDLDFVNKDLLSPEFQTANGRHLRTWGRFAVSLAPYSFSEVAQQDAGPSHSVIPRLFLNKEIPDLHEPINEESHSVSYLQSLLQDSLSLRVLNIPSPPIYDVNMQPAHRARLAILFSGGLDCTVLARITHDLLPIAEPVDLLNVAFENPRIHKNASDSPGTGHAAYELCPDRITGRASYAELCRVCPGRNWNFVAIDIPYEETMRHRHAVISLMHPHNTEMDLSISYALYFAARGQRYVWDSVSSEAISYSATARVLLSGLGADELFGGYTRHATAFKRGGYAGLLDELQLDVSRLGARNLGRDDRVMSHWGREVRFPYLDEKLLTWAMRTPVTDKCGFGESFAGSLSSNSGDSGALEPGKKVLRCLAWKLGMKEVAKEKKRAIQFGARTAKMETGKTKGTQLLS